jgi:hypothetical protein
MTANRNQKILTILGTALGCLTAATGASAGNSPNFTSPPFFSQAGTTYQEWDGYSSAAGPNPPTFASNTSGTANWFDTTAATDGAFLIGNAPNGHVYSFSGVLNPEVTVPGLGGGSGFATTLILQLETEGNEIDLSSVKLTPAGGTTVAYNTSSVTGTPISGGFGGTTYDYLFTWNALPGSAPGYTFDYSTGQTSVSQIATRVDTLTAPAAVPEAATNISFGILVSLGLLGMGKKAMPPRNKAA